MSDYTEVDQQWYQNLTAIQRQVLQERDRQVKKWGYQHRSPLEWFAVLGEEFGEVAETLCEAYANDVTYGRITPEQAKQYTTELIQVAAVAIAAVQDLTYGRA